MAATGRIQPQDNIPRAAFGHYAASAGGGRFQGKSPAAVLRTLWPSDRVSPLLVERGAVQGATTADDAWAGALGRARPPARSSAALGPASAASRLIAAGTTVPLARRSSIRFPRRSGPPEVLPWVAEGAPIPVKQYSLDAAVLGPSGKFATIVVLSAELARASDAEAVFEAILREDAAVSLDAAIFSDAAATDEQPGRPALRRHADHRGHRRRPRRDGGRPQRRLPVRWRRPAARAPSPSSRTRRRPRRSRSSQAGPAAARLAVPGAGGGQVIALDPTAFVSGFGGVPEISTSEQAIVHMDDRPGGHRHRGCAACRCRADQVDVPDALRSPSRLIADVAFTMRGDGLVAVVEDVSW